MIQLGPLTERAMEKEFPECWTILADMMGLEYDLEYYKHDGTDSDVYQVTIYIENEEIVITKESGISTSANIPKDIITQLIINAVKTNRN